MDVSIKPFTSVACDLGEGPIWSAGEQALYWIDVTQRKLFRQKSAEDTPTVWTLEKMPGCFAFRASGMIGAFRNQIAFLDLESGRTTPIEGHSIDFGKERFNDGACDARGRLWAGTFDPSMKTDRGGLYRIDPDRTVTRMADHVNMSNGIAWSPDNHFLYHADSRPGQVYRYPFDLEKGTVGPREIFIDYADKPGRPDGCTVDAEGYLWVAEVEAGRVSRYSPEGELDRSISLPVSKPTSVAFGGSDFETLFVTSMRYGLSEEELDREPLAGRVLQIELGVRGLQDHRFAG